MDDTGSKPPKVDADDVTWETSNVIYVSLAEWERFQAQIESQVRAQEQK